ncbi:shikimate kinase [Roseovarius sp. PS-C2]|nr:shikimate kinase [Roseovarius sp. PS-C2]MBU3259974.1 shikimate kinase [Roseovarius sp. PS-C2]
MLGLPVLVRIFSNFITGISDKITSFSGEIPNFGRGAPTVSAPEQWKLKKTVVLVGMMGAGKTAVGKALAADLGVPFLDSDAEIERAAAMSIAEIFARDGEAFFRDRETEVIDRLLEGEHGILSTGGGAFLAERNRKLISDKGVSVWLKADLQLLWNRVKHKNTRPLLRTVDPYATLREIYEARVPIYGMADLRVEARPEYSIEAMAEKVREALAARADVLEMVK